MILVKITNNQNIKPCNMCQHIIDKYKVRRLYVFSIDPKITNQS